MIVSPTAKVDHILLWRDVVLLICSIAQCVLFVVRLNHSRHSRRYKANLRQNENSEDTENAESVR